MNISNVTSNALVVTEGYWFRHIVPMVIIPLGLLGNILIIIILSKNTYSNVSTFYYMRGLAVSDNLVLVMFSIRWMNYLPDSPIDHDMWFCMLYFIFIRIGLGASAWILLMMSFDRYQRVHFPLHATKYCTIKRARISFTVILLVLVIVHLPQFWRRPDTSGKTLQTQCPFDGIPEEFEKYYMIIRIIVFDHFVPWVMSLAFAIAMTYRVLRYETIRTKRFSRTSADDLAKKITVTAICTTVAFFVLALPFSVYLTIRRLTRPSIQIVSTVVYELFVYLLFCNSAINFYLYMLIMRKFRQEVVDLAKKTFSRQRVERIRIEMDSVKSVDSSTTTM